MDEFFFKKSKIVCTFTCKYHAIGYNRPPFALQVFLWNMDKYTLIRKLEGHHYDVVSCEFSPDGALLATASYDTRVILWDHYKGTVLLELGYGTFQHFKK